jgi:hypothetical protein
MRRRGQDGRLPVTCLAMLIPALSAAWLVSIRPSSATEPADRFLEFSSDRNTWTYDLSTVQTIVPGKFTVIYTTIDNPDLMRLELTAVDTLYNYCAQPDGTYSPPDRIFTLGKADMPVQKISVKTVQTELGGRIYPSKQIGWNFPYQRFAFRGTEEPIVVNCKEDHSIMKSLISNGIQGKTMYDCKRGLMGLFINKDDDLSKAIVGTVHGGFFDHYLALCLKLKVPEPYIPSE